VGTYISTEVIPDSGSDLAALWVDFVGEIEEFPAGESSTSSFNLDAGRYLLICNIAGHY